MRFTTIASGSSGNCTLVHIGNEAVMIDAGFSLKEIRRRMMQTFAAANRRLAGQ